MVAVTRSQAKSSAKAAKARLESLLPVSDAIPLRRSPRKRATSGVTPKAVLSGLSKAKSPATSIKAKVKKVKTKSTTKDEPESSPPVPEVATPRRQRRLSNRSRPVTPRAPRKSDVFATVMGTTDSDMEDVDGRYVTPTPMGGGPRVRFDSTDHFMLIPPRQDNSSSSAAGIGSTSANSGGGSEVAGLLTSTSTKNAAPPLPSPHNFLETIPGDWVRSPGGTSWRLIVIPDDNSEEAVRRRELETQERCERIEREQLAIFDRERERWHRRFNESVAGTGYEMLI